MRILFTIPHYFRAMPDGFHGSLNTQPRMRAAVVTECLASIHRTFGELQAIISPELPRINGAYAGEVKVVVCTARENHLLGSVPSVLFEHCVSDGDPRLLGYHCHQILKDNLGRYDYYCFMEDDLQIVDPQFFQKLRWFESFAGAGRVLQPHRYEQTGKLPLEKLYVDGPLSNPEWSKGLQAPVTQPSLVANALGVDAVFDRVENPHSGCFFLNDQQMRRWTEQPYFLDRSADFVGPLESAATLGLMRTFEVFKPAWENAGFLEVRHLDARYHGKRIAIGAGSGDRS